MAIESVSGDTHGGGNNLMTGKKLVLIKPKSDLELVRFKLKRVIQFQSLMPKEFDKI
jgi:hypothetical protein